MHTAVTARDFQRPDFPSPDLFKAFIESASLAVWVKDLDGRYLFVNRAYCRLRGQPEDALLGRDYRDFVPSEAIGIAQTTDAAVVSTGKSLQFEDTFTVDGEERDFLVIKFPMMRGGGETYAIGCSASDITEGRRAESRFRQAFELPILGRAITAPDTRLLRVNQAFAEMLGYSASELIGRSWKELTHPDDVEPNLCLLEEAVAGKRDSYSCKKRFIHRDGRIVPANISAGCIRRANGSLDHLVLMVLDVTARQTAEDGLRRSEERHRLVAQAVSDAIFDFDLRADRIEWNQQYEKLFGWEITTDRAASVWLSRIHVDDRRRVRRLFAALARHGSAASMQFRLQCAEGPFAHVVMHAFVVRDNDGKAIRSVGSLTDITDDIAARAALEAEVAERRRAEQVAAAHTATLAATLDALLVEPRVDAFAGQVLNTIVEQLGAIGGSFWVRDPATERRRVIYVHDGGRLLRGEHSDHPFARQPIPIPRQVERATETELITLTVAELAQDARAPEGVVAYLRQRSVKKLFGMRLLFGGEVLGGFTVYFIEDRTIAQSEQALAKGLVMQATLALKLARMEEESHRAVLLEERNRMARDIHDTLAQGFTGVIIQLEAAKDVMATGEHAAADHHIRRAADLARSMLAEARRSVHALRPIALEQAGLRGAFLALLDNMTGGTAIESSFTLNGHPRPLPLEWEEALLRVGQEALTNALRHAAMRRFSATLTFSQSGVELALTDDGVGFDIAGAHTGVGLVGMRERVQRLGGQFGIASSPGSGTRIAARLQAHAKETMP